MGKILKSFDEFLSNASSSGGGGSYLKDWTKNGFADPDEPQYRCIDTWLHTICIPQMRWYHPWKRIENREDKDTKRISQEVWSDEFVCHEELDVLVKQYKRDDRDQRDAFPLVCPSCRLIECVYQLVRYGKFVVGGQVIAAGKLSWTEPMFVYEASDPSKSVILHAAGLYNGFKDVEGGDEAKELQAAGIFAGTAWKVAVNAKKSWMFAIVDNTNVTAGVQITEETSMLGDKVAEVITKSRSGKRRDKDDMEDLGNPIKYPFAIRWKYTDRRGTPINKKYDAQKMEAIVLTEAISKLIRSEPRDWFSSKLREGDAGAFRDILQRHATEVASKILPWGWIFSGHASESASSASGEQSRPAQPALAPQAPAPQQASAAQPAPAPMRRKVMAASPPPPPELERFICGDGCDYMLLSTDAVCPKCKATFDVAAPVAPAQPTPAPIQVPANSAQAVASSYESTPNDGDQDDIPF